MFRRDESVVLLYKMIRNRNSSLHYIYVCKYINFGSVPCGSITCIKFYGYDLSNTIVKHPLFLNMVFNYMQS